MPYLQAIFVGTGDLFASCMLAWMHKDNDLKVRTHRGSYMSAHVLLNLLNELGKRDKM